MRFFISYETTDKTYKTPKLNFATRRTARRWLAIAPAWTARQVGATPQ